MCGLHTKPRWKAGVNIHYCRYLHLYGGGGGGGSDVFWRMFPVGDGGGVFGGGFLCLEDLVLIAKVVVRLICGCLNKRTYFFWCLSRILVEWKISNIDGRHVVW